MKVENDLISRSNLLRFLTTMIKIDKDSLKNAHPESTNYLRYQTRVDDFEELRNLIANVSSVDAVEVVRCKDCKYYNEDCMSPHSGWCECLERGEYENHFCSYAERKEGADNA